MCLELTPVELRLVDAHMGYVLSVVSRKYAGHPRLDDLLQEARLRIPHAVQKGRSRRRSFTDKQLRQYLVKAALNRCRDVLRRRSELQIAGDIDSCRARPIRPPSGGARTVSTKVGTHELGIIDEACDRFGMSRSEYLRTAIRAKLGHDARGIDERCRSRSTEKVG